MGIGFRGRNKQKKANQTVKEPTNNGKWKHVVHSETGKVYFYHTKTKETTWTKPDSYQVYKVVKDPSSGRPYFYNQITKQTTWEKPSDFEEWKTAQDKTSGKVYYYNVITQETSWSDPRILSPPTETKKIEENSSVIAAESEANDPFLPAALSHFISFMDPSKYEEDFSSDQEESDITTGSTATPGNEMRRNDLKRDADNQSDTLFIPVPKSKFSVSYQTNDKDRETFPKPQRIVSFDESEVNRKRSDDHKEYPNSKTLSVAEYSDMIEYKNPDQQRLAKLLSLYMPMNKDVAKNLIKCCKGKEGPVLQALDQIIQDSPFDEISIGIYRYAKAYTEGDVESKDQSTVPFRKSAYSMKHPILSALSTRTEQTARVQNKASNKTTQNSTQGRGPWLQSQNVPNKMSNADGESKRAESMTIKSSQPITPSETSTAEIYVSKTTENKDVLTNIHTEKRDTPATTHEIQSYPELMETPQKSAPPISLPSSNITEETTQVSMDPTEDSVSDLSDSFSPLYGKRSVRERNRIEKLNQKKSLGDSPVVGLEKLSLFCQAFDTVTPSSTPSKQNDSPHRFNQARGKSSKSKNVTKEKEKDDSFFGETLEVIASWFNMNEEDEVDSSVASSISERKVRRTNSVGSNGGKKKNHMEGILYSNEDCNWDKAVETPPMYSRRERKLTY